MSQDTSRRQDSPRPFPAPLWALIGCAAVLAVHYLIDPRVPGGALGGAIGGLLGGIAGLTLRSLRNK